MAENSRSLMWILESLITVTDQKAIVRAPLSTFLKDIACNHEVESSGTLIPPHPNDNTYICRVVLSLLHDCIAAFYFHDQGKPRSIFDNRTHFVSLYIVEEDLYEYEARTPATADLALVSDVIALTHVRDDVLKTTVDPPTALQMDAKLKEAMQPILGRWSDWDDRCSSALHNAILEAWYSYVTISAGSQGNFSLLRHTLGAIRVALDLEDWQDMPPGQPAVLSDLTEERKLSILEDILCAMNDLVHERPHNPQGHTSLVADPYGAFYYRLNFFGEQLLLTRDVLCGLVRGRCVLSFVGAYYSYVGPLLSLWKYSGLDNTELTHLNPRASLRDFSSRIRSLKCKPLKAAGYTHSSTNRAKVGVYLSRGVLSDAFVRRRASIFNTSYSQAVVRFVDRWIKGRTHKAKDQWASWNIDQPVIEEIYLEILVGIPGDLWPESSPLPPRDQWDLLKALLLLMREEIPYLQRVKQGIQDFVNYNESISRTSDVAYIPGQRLPFETTKIVDLWMEFVTYEARNLTRLHALHYLENRVNSFGPDDINTCGGLLDTMKSILQDVVFTEFLDVRTNLKLYPNYYCRPHLTYSL